MAVETGLYGEVTIRHELAHGIYQLVLAAGRSLKALIIGKDFAKQVLSQAAIAKADEYDNNTLGYPEQDGRMSIPLFELSQKGIINLPLQEAKAHFNNLLHLIPDYLRSRGILKKKPLPDLNTKLADEAKRFEKQLTNMSKKEIIASAGKIGNFNKIKDLLANSNFPLKNEGLLIASPDLIRSIEKVLSNLNLEINAENVQKVCGSFDEAVGVDKKIIDDALSDIRSELERTQITRVKTVIMQMTVNGESHDFALSVQDFENWLLTNEIKSKFAKAYMLDFPVPDYYGKDYRWLYESLFLKRFGENVQENWERFAPQGENVQLHIKALSTELVVSDSYSDLKNMAHIKGYLQSAYENSDGYVEKLLKSEDMEAHKKTVDEIQKLIDNFEKHESADDQLSNAKKNPSELNQNTNIEEKHESADQQLSNAKKTSAEQNSDIEFVKTEKPKRKPVPESRKMLNKAQKLTADEVARLTDTLVKERIERPGSNRVMYVLNKQKTNEVIRLSTIYNGEAQIATPLIQSYDTENLQNIHDVTELSTDDFKDYIEHLTKPVVMTAAAYSAFCDQRILEQATKFEEEVKPFIQSAAALPLEDARIVVSNIAIETADEIINEAAEVQTAAAIEHSAEVKVSEPQVEMTTENVVEEFVEEEIEIEIG